MNKKVKYRKHNIILLIVFSFFLLLSESILSAKTLKFAHHIEDSNPLHLGALKAAEILEKKSKGRLKMRVYPNAQLGGEVDNVEALSLGTIDITLSGPSTLGSVYGPLSISDYPYVLRGVKHLKAYIKSDLFKRLSSEYSKVATGNEVYGVGFAGTRNLSTSSKRVRKPSDMVGLKIRVPNVFPYVLFPKASGALPTPIAWSEVYLALQQGVVDGQETTSSSFYTSKVYEVQKHVTLTSHIVQTVVFTVSGITLNSLSRADKKILKEALSEGANYSTDLIVKQEEDLYDKFREAGLTVNKVDRKLFSDIVVKEMFKNGGKDLPFSKAIYNELQAIPDAKK